MTQMALGFSPPKPPDDITRNYHCGNPESEAANLRTMKARDRARIIAHVILCGAGGATCSEIELATGLSHQTASARCSELKRDGVLVASGERRPTQTGSMAAVLVIKNTD
jgi:predicted transcriptional regulator